MTYRYKQPIRTECSGCSRKFVRSSPHNKLCPECYKKALIRRPMKINIKNLDTELTRLRDKIKDIKQIRKEANEIWRNSPKNKLI